MINISRRHFGLEGTTSRSYTTVQNSANNNSGLKIILNICLASFIQNILVIAMKAKERKFLSLAWPNEQTVKKRDFAQRVYLCLKTFSHVIVDLRGDSLKDHSSSPLLLLPLT